MTTILDNARQAGAGLAATDADSAGLGFLSEPAWSQLEQIGVLRSSAAEALGRWRSTARRVPRDPRRDRPALAGRRLGRVGHRCAPLADRAVRRAGAATRSGVRIPPGRSRPRTHRPARSNPSTVASEVSGRWSFSSGSHHADAVILGGIVGDPRVRRPAVPRLHLGDRRSGTTTRSTRPGTPPGCRAPAATTSSWTACSSLPTARSRTWTTRTDWARPCPDSELNDGALYRLPWAVVFGAIIAAGRSRRGQGLPRPVDRRDEDAADELRRRAA